MHVCYALHIVDFIHIAYAMQLHLLQYIKVVH